MSGTKLESVREYITFESLKVANENSIKAKYNATLNAENAERAVMRLCAEEGVPFDKNTKIIVFGKALHKSGCLADPEGESVRIVFYVGDSNGILDMTPSDYLNYVVAF
ncbi:hypothetical protein N8000_05240 [Rhodospirillales bacterium]|nr:hypothetical protein [Rhodospirillales bacterium]